MTQSCKICHGTGHVECLNQLCAHWCSCTVCNGTGKVEVYEDWSQGFAEERVRAWEEPREIPPPPETRTERIKRLIGELGCEDEGDSEEENAE